MKLNENIKNELTLPSGMDEQCIELFYVLNSIPDTETFECCCGHDKYVYSMWFRCRSIEVISRLGRAVNKNYSDGKWEIVVDTTDTDPYGIFWLRTTEVLHGKELEESLEGLIDNIKWWFDDKFDEYFKH